MIKYITFVLFWWILATNIEAKEIRVNNGGSLIGARNEVRVLRSQGVNEEVVVRIAPGKYWLNETLVLESQDSGLSNTARTIWRADGGEVVVSGGKEIKNWMQEGNLLKAVIDGNIPYFRQFYVNNQRRQRARSVDGSWFGVVTDGGFELKNTSVGNWGNLSRVELVGENTWKQFRCGVERLSGNQIILKNPCFLNSRNHKTKDFDFSFNKVSWVENAKELLDQPGEWYWDESTKTIYYYPMNGENASNVVGVVPSLEKLVWNKSTMVSPLKFVNFEGISFVEANYLEPNSNNGWSDGQANFTQVGGPWQTLWGGGELAVGVPMANVDLGAVLNVVVKDCEFERLGAAGLSLGEGSKNNRIENNKFNEISGNGIVVGGIRNPKTTNDNLITRGNVVRNNMVSRVGREFAGAVGIFVGYAQATLVANNTIFDVPYTGISVGWGWGEQDPTFAKDNIVEKNLIYNHVNYLMDGGGIYSLSAQPGNVYRKNVILNQPKEYGAIYLDNRSRYIMVEENVVFNNKRTALINGAGDNVLKNNFWQNRYTNDVWDNRLAEYGPNQFTNNKIISNLSGAPATVVNEAGAATMITFPLGPKIDKGVQKIRWKPMGGVSKFALRINDLANGWNCTNVDGDICTDVTGNEYSFNFVEGHKYTIWIHPIYEVTGGAGPSGTVTVEVGGAVQLIGDYYVDGKIDLLDFGVWKDDYVAGRKTMLDFGIWKEAYVQSP